MNGPATTKWDIVLEALEIDDPKEREDYLDRACESDQPLRSAVIELLEIERISDADFLDPARFDDLQDERQILTEELSREEQLNASLGTSVRQLGGYELLEEVGRGAMGVVFRARQASLNRTVAVKVIIGSSLASGSDRERFRVEAEAAANLNHPNVVPVYEIGNHDGFDFYSMKYVPTGTLGDHLQEIGKDLRKAVGFIAKVVDAVQAAHDLGILHRDLKPDNILIDDRGEPLVTDFGLACRLERNSHLTLTGQIMGSPRFMAPEQAAGGSVAITTAADIHSLGAILYELACGEPAFESDSVLETLREVIEKPPRLPHLSQPRIDRDLETIIMKCLEKEPSQRYHSARDLHQDLIAWLEHRPITARPPSPLESCLKWIRRRPIHAALFFTLGCLILTLGLGGPIAAIQQANLRDEADAGRTLAEDSQHKAESESRKAEAERRKAEAERRKAEAATTVAEEQAEQSRHRLYSANMNTLGAACYEPGVYPAVQNLLGYWLPNRWPGKPDLRGWEWFYIASFVEQSNWSIPEDRSVSAMRIDPNSQRYAVVANGRIKVRDLITADELLSFEIEGGFVDLAWSPDGAHIAALSRGGLLVVRDSATGMITAEKQAHQRGTAIDWSPDGEQLVSAGTDPRLRICDSISLEAQSPAGLDTERVPDQVSWSPTGNFLAIRHGNVVLINLETGTSETLSVSAIQAMGWDPTGSRLALSGKVEKIQIWEVNTRGHRKTSEMTGHSGAIFALVWDPSGEFVLAASNHRSLWIWDVGSGDVVQRLERLNSPAISVDWSGDGQFVTAGMVSGNTRMWELDDRTVPRTLFDYESELYSAQMNPDGSRVACIGSKGHLQIIDTATGDLVHTVGSEWWGGRSIHWSSDGTRLAVSIAPTLVCIIDATTGKTQTTIRGEHGPVLNLRWAPGDPNRLLTCSRQWLQVWDATSGEVLQTYGGGKSDWPFTWASWSPDGKYVLATGWMEKKQMWRSETGEMIADKDRPGSRASFTHHAWHPDGSHYALAHAGGYAMLWSTDSPDEMVKGLIGHTGNVSLVAWHPDGDRLATASDDHTIKIWDISSGEVVLTLRDHGCQVKALQWRADGQMLMSAGIDGRVILWDASSCYNHPELAPAK